MFQNHKKHVAATVKQLVTSRKCSMHSDPALECKINSSSETTSSEGDSRIYTHQNVCSMPTNSDHTPEKNDEQITATTCLNNEQEMAMNNWHKDSEQTKITSSGYVIESNDLPRTFDKETEISTISHSSLKQEMSVQTKAVQVQSANSESEAVNSEISYSVPCNLDHFSTKTFHVS
jgi:hypothetical protein